MPNNSRQELLRIAKWDFHFENSKTREVRNMAWVPVPNRFDGDGYTELLDHPQGVLHYGAWVLVLAVASKCSPRGTLLRDAKTCAGSRRQSGPAADAAALGLPAELAKLVLAGARPHDARALSRMTRCPERVFNEAIPRLVSIGWLESLPFVLDDGSDVADSCDAIADDCQDGAGRVRALNGTELKELKGKKETSCTELASPPAVLDEEIVLLFPTQLSGQTWALTSSKLAEYRESFPHLDVLTELKTALQWCRDNERQRKTFDGMKKFLTGWLTRAQNSGRGAKRNAASDKSDPTRPRKRSFIFEEEHAQSPPAGSPGGG